MQNTAFVDGFRDKLFVHSMTFGEWMREQIRKQGGMSNAELARRTGLSPTYIGNLIRDYSPNTKKQTGRPSEDAAEQIARALNASVNEAREAAGYKTADVIPAEIKSIDFDGLDKDDLREIADFISFRKAQKEKSNG